MPNLPAVSVTADQLAACMAVFADADEYRAWLVGSLRDEVQRRTARQLDEEANAAKVAALAALDEELPPPVEVGP